MKKDPRASVDGVKDWATYLGYRVRETNLLDIDNEWKVEANGYGEIIEVYFRPSPETGYLRFHRAGRLTSFSSNPLPTLTRLRAELVEIREYAQSMGWQVDREPDED